MKKLFLLLLTMFLSLVGISQVVYIGDKPYSPAVYEAVLADSVAYYGFVPLSSTAADFTKCVIVKADFKNDYLYAVDGSVDKFISRWSRRATYTYEAINEGEIVFNWGELKYLFLTSQGSVTTNVYLDSVYAVLYDSLLTVNATDSTIAKLAKAIADSSIASTSVAVPVTHVFPNQDATLTWTSSTSLTLSGLPLTFTTDCQIVYVQVLAVDSNYFYMQGVSNINLSQSGGVITITGSTNSVPFPRTASFSVGVNGPERAYNRDLDAYRDYNINARELKMTSPELLINDADEDSASVTSEVFELAAAGYNKFVLQKRLKAVGANDSLNFHIYGTNNPDAVSTSLSGWDDITLAITASAIISVANASTDSIPYNRYESLLYNRIMVRIDYWLVAAGTENNEAIIYLIRSN